MRGERLMAAPLRLRHHIAVNEVSLITGERVNLHRASIAFRARSLLCTSEELKFPEGD